MRSPDPVTDHQIPAALDEKAPRTRPGPYNGFPMTPPSVGAKAVLNPTSAITNTARPVIRIVLNRLRERFSPSSPTSRKPTAMVMVNTSRPQITTQRLFARTSAVIFP